MPDVRQACGGPALANGGQKQLLNDRYGLLPARHSVAGAQIGQGHHELLVTSDGWVSWTDYRPSQAM